MPSRTPVHRQSFRIYNAALRDPESGFDHAFELVVAAEQEPDLVEHALAHLRYVHTDVGIDWVDVIDMVGARRRPAYGVAHVVRGCDGHQAALRTIVAAARKAGRKALVFIQLVSLKDRAAYTLQRLDTDTTALFDLDHLDLVYTSTISPRESHAVVIVFDCPQPE